MNGKPDFKAGGITGNSASFDATSVTCANVYCHGSTLGNTTKPVWNKVDGKQSACGTCHTLPPGGTHPKSTACQTCHSAVIASFTAGAAGSAPTVTWKNGALHIDGKVEMATDPGTGGAGGGGGGGSSGTCTTCHGNATSGAINPPKGTNGETQKTDAAVGAHAEHLATSTWHRTGACSDCHKLPTSNTHSDGKVDFAWSGPSVADGAVPSFSTTALTCTNTYCHGAKLAAAAAGGKVNRTPVWNKVDGTWDACGTTCHTNPPGGTHTTSTACQNCHGDVISAFAPGNPPQVTWKNAALHIDGKVNASSATMTCTSCHGDATRASNKEAPPKGTNGETATTDAAVGAHAQHLGTSTWHRAGVCADCHTTPTSMTHSNAKVDFSWGSPSNADGAAPSYNTTAFTCTNTYCHGSTLAAAASGGSVKRTPVWNQVNNSWDACGTTCHTNPPGGTHAKSNQCAACHADVISALNGTNATWKNAALHINGKVESNTPNCTSCHGNPPTSGTHRRREHNVACSNCHPNSGSGATHLNGKTDTTCGSRNAGCHD
jgi:predicted CxxxxCH...CXXCH cytochrome family protein